jgi:hypothetical protein
VAQSLETPRIATAGLIFLLIALLLTTLLIPSIMSGSQDALQSSSLAEHLSPEDLSSLTSLTPLRRTFAAATMTFFYFWTIVFQAFFVYLSFALARYPGLYREYFSGVLTASWYDILLPMLLSLLFPFIEFSALNPAALFPNLPVLARAFLLPLDLFTLISLLILGKGISLYAKAPPGKTYRILAIYLLARTLFWGALNLFFA